MEQFTKGQYSGNIVGAYGQQGILFSRTTYERSSFSAIRHYHENAHISLVIRGGCLEKKKEDYQRLPGSLTFYPAGEPHQIRQVAPVSIHLNLEFEPQFFQHYQLGEDSLGRAVCQRPDGKFLLLKIQNELQEDDAHTALSIQMLLLDFVSESRRISQKRPAWINQVQALLEENWTEPTNLERLSAAIGMHPVTICKYFHQYVGCTLGHYLRKLKVEKALALISQGNNTLSEITYQCGFADQSHFIRTFKQLTRLLPRQYQSL